MLTAIIQTSEALSFGSCSTGTLVTVQCQKKAYASATPVCEQKKIGWIIRQCLCSIKEEIKPSTCESFNNKYTTPTGSTTSCMWPEGQALIGTDLNDYSSERTEQSCKAKYDNACNVACGKMMSTPFEKEIGCCDNTTTETQTPIIIPTTRQAPPSPNP